MQPSLELQKVSYFYDILKDHFGPVARYALKIRNFQSSRTGNLKFAPPPYRPYRQHLGAQNWERSIKIRKKSTFYDILTKNWQLQNLIRKFAMTNQVQVATGNSHTL